MKIDNILQSLLDLIYPPRCEVCGVLGPLALCHTCASDMVLVEAPYCQRCGLLQPVGTPQSTCPDCRDHRLHYDAARCVGLHTGSLRRAILNFKFENRRRLQEPLGALLAQRIEEEPVLPLGQVDCLVPVPLHPSRRNWRGFDQALYLARGVEKRLGLPVLSDGLIRTRPTTPQVQLSPTQRHENIKGAFAGRPSLQGKKILLLDDVFTTGATVNEAAKAARQSGATRVYVLTISRPAPPWHPAAIIGQPGDL